MFCRLSRLREIKTRAPHAVPTLVCQGASVYLNMPVKKGAKLKLSGLSPLSYNCTLSWWASISSFVLIPQVLFEKWATLKFLRDDNDNDNNNVDDLAYPHRMISHFLRILQHKDRSLCLCIMIMLIIYCQRCCTFHYLSWRNLQFCCFGLSLVLFFPVFFIINMKIIKYYSAYFYIYFFYLNLNLKAFSMEVLQ